MLDNFVVEENWTEIKLCFCRKLKKQVYLAVQALEADLMSLNKLSRYV